MLFLIMLQNFVIVVKPFPRNSSSKLSEVAVFNIPELTSDVISGVTVKEVGMGGCMKFGDSRSNRSRDI